jgi:hypothetical protein
MLHLNAIKDATDIEEFLTNLGKLEMGVKRQYEALANQNPQMIPYADFWK